MPVRSPHLGHAPLRAADAQGILIPSCPPSGIFGGSKGGKAPLASFKARAVHRVLRKAEFAHASVLASPPGRMLPPEVDLIFNAPGSVDGFAGSEEYPIPFCAGDLYAQPEHIDAGGGPLVLPLDPLSDAAATLLNVD